jgi:hypothetical protein
MMQTSNNRSRHSDRALDYERAAVVRGSMERCYARKAARCKLELMVRRTLAAFKKYW